MYYLSETTQKLQIALYASVETSDLDVAVSYAVSKTTYKGKTFVATTDSTEDVDISDAPLAGQRLEINQIDVINLDTAPATVFIKLYDSAATPTSKILHACTISPGDKLQYSNHRGWEVSDSGGTKKQGQTFSTGRTAYNWTTELISEPIAEDLDGETIQNSSFEAMRCTKVVPIDVIQVSCSRSSFDATVNKDPYVQHVNSRDYTIGGKTYTAGQLIIWDMKVLEYEELGTIKYRFEYVFKGRTDMADPWQFRPIDEGFYAYNFTTDQWEEITTGAGTPVARPVLLDGSGAELDVETGTPVRLTFRRYESADFNDIVFP